MNQEVHATIAVCGIAGSFSEVAARQLALRGHLTPTLSYQVTAAASFEAVAHGSAHYAVVPLANSLGGPVLETVAAMSRHTFRVSDVLAMRIKQNLFVLPGKTKSEIRVVVSHAQALSQCRTYLANHFGGVSLQEYADTALAAQDLSTGRLPSTTAIIASIEAGAMFNLECLASSINDEPENYTTFLLICDVGDLT